MRDPLMESEIMKMIVEVCILTGLVVAVVRPRLLMYFLIFSLLEPSRMLSLGNYTVLGATNIKFCEIVLVFLCIGAVVNRTRSLWVCLRPSMLVFFAFAVFSLVRGVAVFDFGNAAFNQFRTFAAVAMCVVVPLLYNTPADVRPLLVFFAASISIFGALEFLDVLHLNPIAEYINSPYRVMSMLGGTPGAMLAMPFLYIACTLRFYERRRTLALAGMIWCFILAVLSASRGVWIGLLGGIGGLVWFLPLRRKLMLVVTIVAMLLVASLFFSGYYVERYEMRLLDRFKLMLDIREGNAQWRLDAWRQMVDDIREHPFIGWPFGSEPTFYVYSRGYYEEVAPHNEYLKIARYMGVFGLAAFVWFMVSIFLTGWRFLQRVRNTREYYEMVGWLLCFVFHAITSMFTQEYTTLDISAIVWAIPGMIVLYDVWDCERRLPAQP